MKLMFILNQLTKILITAIENEDEEKKGKTGVDYQLCPYSFYLEELIEQSWNGFSILNVSG